MGRLVQPPQPAQPIGDIPRAEFEAAHYRKETIREDHDIEAGLILSSRGKRVVMLIHDLDVRVISEDGEILRRFTLDPRRDYQPLGS